MSEFKIASETTVKAAVIVAQVLGLQKELEEIKEAVKATERKGPAYKILLKVQKEKEAEIAEVEDTNYFLASEAVTVEETVLLTASQYQDMQYDLEFLESLKAAGVDNWSGYDDAKQMMSDDSDNDPHELEA